MRKALLLATLLTAPVLAHAEEGYPSAPFQNAPAPAAALTILERVRDLTGLTNVVRIAQTRHVKLTDSKTDAVQTLDLHDLPNEYVQGPRDYLGQTGAFDLNGFCSTRVGGGLSA